MLFESISIVSLMLAIVLIWSSRQYLWILPFLLFLATGLISNWLEPVSMLSIAILGAVVWWHTTAHSSVARKASLGLLVLVALIFAAHLPPGFTTLPLWPNTELSEHSGWSALRFTADKPLVALCLLLAYRSTLCRTGEEWRNAFATTVRPMLLGIGAVYLVGLAIGYVVIDVSLSPLIVVWFFRNLLFTVIAEEIFFRTVVQSRLEAALSMNHAEYYALGITAVLFGMVHLYAGWQYGLLATLAGIVYGYVYYTSRRVEMAIVAHILLNFGHVLLLSYPSYIAP